MRLDDLFTHLFELDFHDRWPLIDLLKKHRGKERFIHFTKPLDSAGGSRKSPDQFKFGINPVPNQYWRKPGQSGGMTVKTHNDPEGIYFYPVDWLFSDHERMRSGDQFALNWPRWYIIDIDWSAPGIVLSKVTWADVESLADRNGWRNLLDEYRAEPEKFKNAFPYWMNPDNAAHVMWCLLDYFQRSKTISWRKALKGLAYVYDDNNSIIYSHEPHQLLVLDPKIMKVVDSGDQQTAPLQSRDTNSYQYWSGAITKLFQRLRGSRGGEINYKRKIASYSLQEGGCSFHVEFSGNWKTGVSMKYQWGRAVADWFGEFKNFENIDALADAIEREMDKAIALAKRKQDLLFKPMVGIETATKFVKATMAGDRPVTVSVEIENKASSPFYRIIGKSTTSLGDAEVTTQYRIMCERDRFVAGIDIQVNGESIGQGGASIEGGQSLETIPETLRNNLDRGISTSMELRQPGSDYSRKFYHEDTFKAFLGWLAINANLNSQTTLNNYLADHIEDYEIFKDDDHLAREVAHSFRKSYW